MVIFEVPGRDLREVRVYVAGMGKEHGTMTSS